MCGAVVFKLSEKVRHEPDDNRINAARSTAFVPLFISANLSHNARAMQPAEIIREWLKATVEKLGVSAAEWARRAGVSPSTVQRAMKDDYQFVTSSRTLVKLAEYANVDPPAIISGIKGPKVAPRYLPVRYKVQAGLWYEIDVDEPPIQASFAVAPDPRFADYPQWLELVVGDSVNQKIPPGHYAHVVDAVAMGYAPQDGQWVVVERRRDQGRTRERTIKQIAITEGGAVQLWPRSDNPKWCQPVSLTEGVGRDDTIEAEIVGLVVGAYNPDFAS